MLGNLVVTMEASGVLRVIRASNLPKTDRFSAIDAYIAVSQEGREIGKTVVKEDNPNPTWNQVPGLRHGSAPYGSFTSCSWDDLEIG